MVKLFVLVLTFFLAFAIAEVKAQISNGRSTPVSFSITQKKQQDAIPLKLIPALDRKQAEIEDAQWVAQGHIPRIGRILPVNIDPQREGTWDNLRNGDRIWRMRIIAEEAQAISLYFSEYNIPHGAQIHIYSTDKKHIIGGFGAENNHESRLMATQHVFSQDIIVEYYEPAHLRGQGKFIIDEIGYGYKAITDFRDSESCQVNVNCSEGSGLENQRNAVARILVRVGNSQGWCSGTLINNVRQNCTPYFITALHCGLSGSALASAANLNQWIFYFNYQATGCTTPSSQPSTSQSITGATARANSNDGGGNTGSDLLLLQLNSTPPSSYNVYYAGWNVNNTTTTGGFGIHHPAGDIKKISKFTNTTTSASWGGSVSGTHWGVNWISTANGHGTTEGGSSGSALFNNNGLMIGTLTGGGSSCSSRNAADYYGKMSYHWTSNGSSAAYRLKDWLDPDNTGTTILQGIAAPCTQNSLDAGIVEILNPAPGTLTCDNPIAPQIVLKNYGTTTLTRVTITTSLNNTVVNTYNWTGSLASNNQTTVTLPAVTLQPDVTSTFSIVTSAPNNGTDQNTANNSAEATTFFETPLNLPYQEKFNAGSIPANIFVNNPDQDDFLWTYVANASSDGTGGSIKFDNFNGTNTNNPRGTWDYFFLPDLNFSNNPTPVLTYDIAHRPYSTTSNDSLFILVSTDCGQTYQVVYAQGGANLASVTGVQTTDFTPSASQWANRTLNLSNYGNQGRVSIVFGNKSNWGNNIYIDNINILSACNLNVSTANYSDVSCPGASNGMVELSTTGGTAPYRYKWNANNEQTSGRFNNFAAGNYTITITDAVGCSTTRQVSFTEPVGLVITPNVTNATCAYPSNGRVYFTALNLTGTVTYNIGNGAQGSNTFNNVAPGNYTVTITYGSSCSATRAFTVNGPANPMQATTTLTHINCYNANTGKIVVNVQNGSGTYTYNRGTGNQSSNTFNNLAAGTYNITVTSSQGCIATTSAVITQPTSGIMATLAKTDISCRNTTTGSITVNANNGIQPYTYNIGAGIQSSNVFNNLAAGAYTITVTSGDGCSTTASTTITQPSVAFSAILSKTDIGCRGGNDGKIVVTPQNGTQPYTYNIGQGPQTSNTFSNLAVGTYTITVTSGNGCIATATSTISQPANDIQATLSKTDVVCRNNSTGSITVTASNSTAPYTYNIGNGTQSSNTFNNLAAGIYTVTVTSSVGCVTTATTTITEPATDFVATLSKTDIICPNTNTGSISVSTINGIAPYTYNIGQGAQSANTFTNLAVGSYTVTVTSAVGCVATASTNIAPPSNPLMASMGTITQQSASCTPQNNGAFTVNATAGTAPYTYNIGQGPQTSNTFSGLGGGLYVVTVTDANGCTATTSATLNDQIPLVNATVQQGAALACSNSTTSLTVMVSGGSIPYSYNMGSGIQSSNTFNNIAAGTYNITVTDAVGCNSIVTTTVVAPAALQVNNTKTDITCYGAHTGSIQVNVTNGRAPYTYNAGIGTVIANTVTNLPVGMHTVTITDANGCTATTTATINQPSAPIRLEIYQFAHNACFDTLTSGYITVTALSGQAPYTYNIGNGAQNSNAFHNLAGGNYTITVTDANGCTNTISKTILEPASALTSRITALNHLTCTNANNGSVTLTTTGGVTPYTYTLTTSGALLTQTSPSFANLPAGAHTITVEDSLGCAVIIPVTIQDAAEIMPNAQINPITCIVNTASIVLNPTGGRAPYTYAWSNGQTTSGVQQLSAGAYAVTIADAQGCSTVGNYIISAPTPLIANVMVSADNYTATTVPTGGTAPYTYIWSNGTIGATLTNVANTGTYTVTVTDAQGCMIVSAPVELYPVGVENLNNQFVFEVFPNPNEGDFNVKIEYLAAREFEVSVVDVLGRNLATYNFNESMVHLPMNMKQYPSGVYFILLKSAQQVESKKVIIAR